ncbi:MAG: methyltransferase domain-containing protein [archaeon]|nr:methyltransferase domain-containing protein [archaeon]
MTSTEIKEQQRELWNKFSLGWKKWDNFVMSWLKPIGEKLLEKVQLRNGEKILDVATGTGEPGISAAKLMPNATIVGIDLSEEMVQLANQHSKEKRAANYSAQVEDIQQGLSFTDNYFDKIICRFGIMFFPNPASDFKEIVRVLKSGGRITFSAWAEPSKNPWATTAASVINKLLELPAPPTDAPGIFRHSNPNSLRQLFMEAGLTNIVEEEITGSIVFDNSEKYWEFVMDVVAPVAIPLSKADDATRQKAKEKVIEECSRFKKENGKIIFPWSSWICSAVKL